MQNLIILATGTDRPGIVSEISGVITSHGGNVEESRMSKMGSDFAIIMLVSVSTDWIEALNVSLQAIANLNISTKFTEAHQTGDIKKCRIDLNGADNEGILNVLSEYLAGKSINIIAMNTHVSQAPITGTPLFNLNAIITLPQDIIIEEINADLEGISQKLGVEIIINEAESVIEDIGRVAQRSAVDFSELAAWVFFWVHILVAVKVLQEIMKHRWVMFVLRWCRYCLMRMNYL